MLGPDADIVLVVLKSDILYSVSLCVIDINDLI